MAQERILIVDDEPQIRMALGDRLRTKGYSIDQARNGLQCLEKIHELHPDLVLLDLQMPEMGGMDVLRKLGNRLQELPVVILTAHGSIEQAVEAMKLGAIDFLPKPCKADHILFVVEKALERKELKEENLLLREEIDSQYQMILGESPEMKKVMEMARQVASSKTTVLLHGESGTGKQLLARSIHSMSDRKNKSFVQVTCTTLSEQLLESDLFGHEKGAFTGAVKQKKGRFELAHRGTVFLDEIGDLTPSIQARLLHVIEYGEFQRVGGTDTLRVDVRIIAASNKDLQEEVREGRFREDLFYRLNVMTLTLPPLRTRKEDIHIFADHFLQKHSRMMQKNVSNISADAKDALMNYSWPGNIRELDNAIQRAVVLADGEELTAGLLPPLPQNRSCNDIGVGLSLEEALLKFKRQFITDTLRSTAGNQTKAADLLRIQRTYLSRLIKEMGLKRPK